MNAEWLLTRLQVDDPSARMESRTIKLKIHPRNFSDEELIVNVDALSRDKVHLKYGDIIEICPPEEQFTNQKNHLFLQVKHLSQDVQAKGGPLSISISNEVAQQFNLVGVREVCVRTVEREEVGLDLVELRFKDQCLTRSDMWRFTSSLIGKCLYKSKKLQYFGIRTQVNNVWSRGEVVSCGVVVKRTRVVFRSASAQVFLYLQISSEMWDYDTSGDLYFDKAVSGFLKELFQNWKDQSCNHNVTIVFFSRIYYDSTQAIEHFPLHVRSNIHQDKRGVFYEDFYKVIVEGESPQDWSNKIMDMKRSFIQFKQLLTDARGEGFQISPATNGNILEALNLAVNVIEKHYIDCNLLMSGQAIIIVSPGAAVFDVDHELTRLTKRRMVEGGISADVVSLCEQPYHAVPLFRSHVREEQEYHIPHWMNYGFYKQTHVHPWNKFRFQPQIQISDHLINAHLNRGERNTKGAKLYNPNAGLVSQGVLEDKLLNRVNYMFDEYDAAIFTGSGGPSKARSVTKMVSSPRVGRTRYHSQNTPPMAGSATSSHVTFSITPPDDDDPFESPESTSATNPKGVQIKPSKRRPSRDAAFSSSLKEFRGRFHSEDLEDHTDRVEPSSITALQTAGSAEALRMTYFPKSSFTTSEPQPRKRKSFINPFDPNKIHTDVMTNQHGWVHVFPRDKEGVAFQAHHAIMEEADSLTQSGDVGSSIEKSTNSRDGQISGVKEGMAPVGIKPCLKTTPQEGIMRTSTPKQGGGDKEGRKTSFGMLDGRRTSIVSERFLFGAEKSLARVRPKSSEDFGLVRRTGLDWNSLTEPACFPITTDYFPSQTVLSRDYAENPTSLVVNSLDTARDRQVPHWRSDHQSLDTFEAFREMISQRVSQGFQLVFDVNSKEWGQNSLFSLYDALKELEESTTKSKSNTRSRRYRSVVVKMSLDRVFQKIELTYPANSIQIYIYRNKSLSPRVQQDMNPYRYVYQLWTCEQDGFIPAMTEFRHTKVEEYNWNYLDQHVCGYPDFEVLSDSQKCWRSRYLLLPKESPLTDGSPEDRKEKEEALVSSFVRFLEFLNHTKRGGTQSRSQTPSYRRYNSLPVLYTPIQHSGRSTPQETHSLASSPIPTPAPLPNPIGALKGRILAEIDEASEDSSPKQRAISPLVTQERSEVKTKGDRGNERTRNEKNSDSRGKWQDSKNTSPIARKKVREDQLHPVVLDKDQRPDSPLRVGKGSPKGKRRGHRVVGEVIRDLKEISDSSPASSMRPHPSKPLRKSESVLITVTQTQTDRESALESSLDHVIHGSVQSVGIEFAVPEGPSSPSPDLRVPLTRHSPVKQILKAMCDPENSIDFLDQPELRVGSFVAMEAVKWLMENVEDVCSRKDGIKIMQVMLEEQLVVHSSGDTAIPFLDGYFLYSIQEKQEEAQKDSLERSYLVIDNDDFDVFSKNWFEAAIKFPSPATSSAIPLFNSSSPSSSPTSGSFQHSKIPYYMAVHRKETVPEAPASMLNRYVELNPDPQGRSDRREWCFVRYDHTYHPSWAFQLEFQWMVTTAGLFHQLIQSWLHKATMCGFNLVAVPMLQSLSKQQTCAHPFRRHLFIGVIVPGEILERWKETDSLILNYADNFSRLLSAITNKCGFLVDPSSVPLDTDVLSPHYDSPHDFVTSRLYVHHSGCALVQPVCEENSDLSQFPWNVSSNPLNRSTPVGSPKEGSETVSRTFSDLKCGFYWYRNFLLPKQKNIPANVLAKHDSLFSDFHSLCSNKDGQLLDLCNQLFH